MNTKLLSQHISVKQIETTARKKQDSCSSEGSCPFAGTDASEQAQGYGCLPNRYEIIALRTRYGKTWACHYDKTRPCVGAIKQLKQLGHEYKVIDPVLVTDEDDWNEHGPLLPDTETLFSFK